MRAVSNTSPLSNLAIINRLDLLRQRYGVVPVPPAVSNELSRLTHSGAQARLSTALEQGWLKIETPNLPPPGLPFPLDSGETEAITLALSIKADVLLIDEKRGRIAARSVGLSVAAGFFIDSEIEKFILSAAGE